MTPGKRVFRKCWPTNVGTVREVVAVDHLRVEWDDKRGELFDERPSDVDVPPVADLGDVELRVAAVAIATAPTAGLSRDRLTGRAWLTFVTKPGPETIAALKAAGWRWSGYRKAWNHPRKGIVPPVPCQDDGLVDYSAERADRLEDRAGRVQAQGDAAYGKAKTIADSIPLGQPILVGHHSERRSRRDAQRICEGFEKAFENYKEADRLNTAAEASRAHQERIQSVPVTQRRLDRLRADLRAMDLRREQWGEQHKAAWQARRDSVAAEVSRAEAELTAAGGPVTVDCKPGDIIKVSGHTVRVDRVNQKTISGEIVAGGAKGMIGKWDKSRYQGKVTQ